ncbi:ATP-grasp domain-containing protein [Paenibacillus polymyxa]|uniref:ATP-grasp domain-containing protein n=1 Tax=Paenibacillus polymyxa TaxID=1406 RepID=UPI0020253A61|nr:ATP-grasp domain-containing protein [Paenibacillus polymyxa]URJ61303.3 ATP-grasp domain-containing protein [Paenibacillus polymyxa]
MYLLFCSDPLNSKNVDMDYREECEVARSLGFDTGLVNFDNLIEDEREESGSNPYIVSKNMREYVAKQGNEYVNALYRGWMLRPKVYDAWTAALEADRIRMLTSAESYRNCHYFPDSYSLIQNFTPRSVWLERDQLDAEYIRKAVMPFGKTAIMVKDFVKSRKHDWLDACYIPDASDQVHVERVIRRFVELQGTELNGGIVLREFVPLEFLTLHPKSGMPLSKEYRLFFMFGEPVFTVNYWDEAAYETVPTDLDEFIQIARQIQSPFFTMDIARTQAGQWIIIELGDGQVSGLPEHTDLEAFYTNLKKAVVNRGLW